MRASVVILAIAALLQPVQWVCVGQACGGKTRSPVTCSSEAPDGCADPEADCCCPPEAPENGSPGSCCGSAPSDEGDCCAPESSSGAPCGDVCKGGCNCTMVPILPPVAPSERPGDVSRKLAPTPLAFTPTSVAAAALPISLVQVLHCASYDHVRGETRASLGVWLI